MRRSARRLRQHRVFHPGIWLLRHVQVALGSLGSLLGNPLGSLMTILVIGIALALPAGMLVLLGNLQQVVGVWEGPASITLFLHQEVDEQTARALGERIQSQEQPASVRVISRDAALAEFREYSGFGQALDILEENPLPAVILVRPKDAADSPQAATRLADRLGELAEVELVRLDLQWVQRLHGITEVARRGAQIIACLLALAVLMIVGNTIRLEIQGRHEEIAIVKLVGATDAFVRRPYLYQGFWLGLLGGLIAWMLVASAVVILDPPVTRVAQLYHSGFRLLGPGILESAALLGFGALIGWIGAGVAVSRHLSAIEPD